MAKSGVLIETENDVVKETSLGVMAAAAGTDIYALVMNRNAAAVRDTLAQYGASVVVEIPGGQEASPDFAAAILAAAAKEYDLENILGTASVTGKDLFARTAALMNQPLVSDVLEVNLTDKTVKKSHFSGKTVATLKVAADVFLCTVRPNVIEPVTAPAAGEITMFDPGLADPGLIKVIAEKKGASDKLDLTEASVIITGGRAINGAENFAMLEACAAKMDAAAVGASRAAVDAGYAPHRIQVGQTGKTVSPKLYIACGVSGAVQHFAGMKSSKVIVGINEDKDATIFTKCDYGIVGDIFDVVPKLTEKL